MWSTRIPCLRCEGVPEAVTTCCKSPIDAIPLFPSLLHSIRKAHWRQTTAYIFDLPSIFSSLLFFFPTLQSCAYLVVYSLLTTMSSKFRIFFARRREGLAEAAHFLQFVMAPLGLALRSEMRPWLVMLREMLVFDPSPSPTLKLNLLQNKSALVLLFPHTRLPSTSSILASLLDVLGLGLRTSAGCSE